MSRCFAGLIALTVLTICQRAAEAVDFEKEIAPLLVEHCIKCHYPGLEKGGVSLATSEDLLEAEHVIAGKPAESYILDLIRSTADEPATMPKDAPALSEEQVALVERWIAEGAKWPENAIVKQKSEADRSWWSLQPLRNVEPPESGRGGAGMDLEAGGDSANAEVHDYLAAWTSSPIDRFVLKRLTDQKLLPNRPADKLSLLRRVTYDLTGLPPSPEQVAGFLEDGTSDAYEVLVDKLLSSPAYGRRWGRHWLDVVRFGESTGYEQNLIIDDAWPFRDYVIDSINADKPFNQFIREQIAGDVINPSDPTSVIGAAFLVNGPYDTVGNQDAAQAAQIRANTIDEMVRTTSEAFLGLTVGCARCHDHKFDPIQQADYYRMYATFAGVKHGSSTWASASDIQARNEMVAPLEKEKSEIDAQITAVELEIETRAKEQLPTLEKHWTRLAVDRTGTEEIFEPVEVQFLRLVCDGRDDSPTAKSSFQLDEFEVWSAGQSPKNVALQSEGGKASGPSRNIEDFPGAYGPQLVNDGKFGSRFISASNQITIELAEPTAINRVLFSSARGELKPEQPKFRFISEYRIEVSSDGETWTQVADGTDRKAASKQHAMHRAKALVTTTEDRSKLAALRKSRNKLNASLAAIPPLPRAWIGNRDQKAAEGPFHIFLGGSPAKHGDEILPSSLSFLDEALPGYSIEDLTSEGDRRVAFSQWVTDDRNPLTTRVLVNRVWHYHFGQGLVKTPSDFGYMGIKPSHPELLDWLASQLIQHRWRIKPLHKMILMSQTYQQSSEGNAAAAAIDGEATLLWRFKPRRLSAEEIRDSMLEVSGVLDPKAGGPGFRLYNYLRDNVATYVPLDNHGKETYRRAVYHQNARACRTDLMTDFDQPDCAFSTARRANTTTPLQALTSLNHSFTLDMSDALASRVKHELGDDADLSAQIERCFLLCFNRAATQTELEEASALVEATSLATLARALLNASEFIYVN